MVALFAVGALLLEAGRITVGEIVTLIGQAGLLIGRLDQLSGSLARVFVQSPTIQALFDLMDAEPGLKDGPDAEVLDHVRGEVVFERVSHWFLDTHMGGFRRDLLVWHGGRVEMVDRAGLRRLAEFDPYLPPTARSADLSMGIRAEVWA